MASVPSSLWFCFFKPTKTGASSTKTIPRTCTFKSLEVSSSSGPSNAESSSRNSSNSLEKLSKPEPTETDPVKLAIAKAKAYKISLQSNRTPKIVQDRVSESTETKIKNDELVSELKDGGNQEVPIAVKLALKRAKEYKMNEGVVGSSESVEASGTVPGLKGGNKNNLGDDIVEKRVGEKEELSQPMLSRMDFMGLDFSDKKKSKGLPTGLLPLPDPFPEGDLPEVEIILGDASKFCDTAKSKPKPVQEDNSDLYKPKVSTWGVFPRPNNISKAYGGGRVICPGEVLETAEDKAAKEARTNQLLAAYKSKVGLNFDLKLKSECEKALKDGDSLMDLGKLKEALPFYENVMDRLAFQSELHGLAALQWSICQDSLSRPNEAGVMYERLQSHPNAQVSKKARQFMFGFQAMKMMKVRSSSVSPMSSGYQNYFKAFIEDKPNYPIEEAEVQGALSQALPYIIFLVSPILLVLFFSVRKGI